MRPERTPRTLRQIADACSFVLSVTEGKALADYAADRLLRQAVERNLEIVGEAVGRLGDNLGGTDVFGSPAYVLGGEVFWGQDRIELLDDAVRAGRAPFRGAP